MGIPSTVRVDKWLWAARFFKTRSMASKACELGRILLNGQPVKPSREVKPADKLRVTNDGGIFEIEVIALSDIRGPAAVAQTLYSESDESKLARAQVKEANKAMPQFDFAYQGRPSKRDRRVLGRLRGRY